MKRLDDMEQLLHQCEDDLLTLQKMKADLAGIEQRKVALAHYYDTAYKEDYESFESKDKHYRILDQDSIWNVLQDQYAEKIALLKMLAESL